MQMHQASFFQQLQEWWSTTHKPWVPRQVHCDRTGAAYTQPWQYNYVSIALISTKPENSLPAALKASLPTIHCTQCTHLLLFPITTVHYLFWSVLLHSRDPTLCIASVASERPFSDGSYPQKSYRNHNPCMVPHQVPYTPSVVYVTLFPPFSEDWRLPLLRADNPRFQHGCSDMQRTREMRHSENEMVCFMWSADEPGY